jgi:hypothetical protein
MNIMHHRTVYVCNNIYIQLKSIKVWKIIVANIE